MRSCLLQGLLYAWLFLGLPWVTTVAVHTLQSSELASFVAFALSAACVAVAFALTQFVGITFGLVRLVRSFLQSGFDPDAPLSLGAKILVCGPPLGAGVVMYGSTGLLFWAFTDGGVVVFATMLVLGIVAGLSMSAGLWMGLIDPDDADALGVGDSDQSRRPQ